MFRNWPRWALRFLGLAGLIQIPIAILFALGKYYVEEVHRDVVNATKQVLYLIFGGDLDE